jgi:hypothetical protein
MRRTLLLAGIGVLGAAVGLAIAFLLLRPDSSPNLGATTLAKVSKDFVAHRRTAGAGITFFDHPKPYGEWLCRVNAYYVPEKVLKGKLALEQDWWADNLSVSTLYGVWRRPSLGSASDAARHKACAEFRDFDHLFGRKDTADPERGAFLLDRIISLLASDKLDIPLSCSAPGAQGHPSKCDARTLLKSVNLQALRGVEAISEQEIDHGMRRTDELSLEPSKGVTGELLELRVVSDQHFGKQSASEGDVRSVEVIIPCVC